MHTRVGVFVVAYDALLSINSLHDVHILVCTRYVQAAFSIYGPGIPRSQIWPLRTVRLRGSSLPMRTWKCMAVATAVGPSKRLGITIVDNPLRTHTRREELGEATMFYA